VNSFKYTTTNPAELTLTPSEPNRYRTVALDPNLNEVAAAALRTLQSRTYQLVGSFSKKCMARGSR